MIKEFSRCQMLNTDFSLNRKIIASNLCGGYASSTPLLCNTDCFDGLLCVEHKGSEFDYDVLLSCIDEAVVSGNKTFGLSMRRYPDAVFPTGHRQINTFTAGVIPSWIYSAGNIDIKREMIFLQRQNTILISYSLLNHQTTVKLRIAPLLNMRSSFSLPEYDHKRCPVNTPIEGGILYRPYPERDDLKIYLQMQNYDEFVTAPDLHYNFEYKNEKSSNKKAVEHLFTPGFFEAEFNNRRKRIIFSASVQMQNPKKLSSLFLSELTARTFLDRKFSFEKNLNSFFITRKGNSSVFTTGFPPRKVTYAESFFALPCIAGGKNGVDVFLNFTSEFAGNNPDIDLLYNNPDELDAPLWFVYALGECARNVSVRNRKKLQQLYAPAVEKIFEGILQNKFGGLIYNESNALISKDINDLRFTLPAKFLKLKQARNGYTVDINSLWYNALCVADNYFSISGADMLSVKVKDNFKKIFFNKLSHTVTDAYYNNYVDFTVRPFMLFSGGLQFSPADSQMINAVVDCVKRELVTPCGIRTVSPQNPLYNSEDVSSGAAVAFFNSFYTEILLKTSGRQAVKELKSMIRYTENSDDGCFVKGAVSALNSAPPYQIIDFTPDLLSFSANAYADIIIDNCSNINQNIDD